MARERIRDNYRQALPVNRLERPYGYRTFNERDFYKPHRDSEAADRHDLCEHGREDRIDLTIGSADRAIDAYNSTKEKFIRLRDKWKSDCAHMSSVTDAVLDMSYQSIIGMGHDVIPILLEEIRVRPDNWFWALVAIATEKENPVPEEHNGNWDIMTKLWTEWGIRKGYIKNVAQPSSANIPRPTQAQQGREN